MSSKEDYTGTEYAVAHIYGLRTFLTGRAGSHREGELRSVVYQSHLWQLGVNEAKCFAWSPKKHSNALDVVPQDCTCGIYAFHGADDFDQFYNWGNYPEDDPDWGLFVFGIVRGGGRATVGSRGFRVQHAEIVALIDPRKPSDQPAAPRKSFTERLYERFRPPAPVDPKRPQRDETVLGQAEIDAIAANYHGVPWYANPGEAIAAHPLGIR